MKRFIQSILALTAGAAAGAISTEKVLSEPLKKNQENAEKFHMLFKMMNQWVDVKQKGINLSKFFEENGYKKIAIYGMATVGETFFNELTGTGIEVVYGIDRNKTGVAAGVPMYSPDDELPDADVIVVSAISYFDEIATMLEEKTDCPVISLEDVVYNTL